MPNNNVNTNSNNNRRIAPEVWVFSSAFVLGMILFGTGMRGCDCNTKTTDCNDCKAKTEITVGGDAVIVKDSQNTDIKINKGNGNIINDNNGTVNTKPKHKPKPQPKPKPKPDPIPVAPAPVVKPKPEPKPQPKPEPKPEPECKTVTTVTTETYVFTGSDAASMALRMLGAQSH